MATSFDLHSFFNSVPNLHYDQLYRSKEIRNPTSTQDALEETTSGLPSLTVFTNNTHTLTDKRAETC